MSKRLHLWLSLRTQFENLGDLLINAAAIAHCQRDADMYLDVTDVPGPYRSGIEELISTSEVFIVDGVLARMRLQLRLALTGRLVLLLKPGNYPGINSARLASRRAMHALYLLLLRSLGASIVRLPSSQGKSAQLYSWIETLRHSLVCRTYVRDSQSVELIKGRPERIFYAPDLVFHHYRSNKVKSWAQRPYGGLVSLRYDRLSLACVDSLGSLKLAIEKLGPGLPCGAISQVAFDNATTCTVAKGIESGVVKLYDYNNPNPSFYFEQYGNAKYVISNRLHVLLLGLVCGAVPIALVTEEDAKVIGYLKDIGLSGHICYAASDIDATKLLSTQELMAICSHQKALLSSALVVQEWINV